MEELVQQCQHKMDKAIESLKQSLSTIRSGSVSPNVLDKILINYYGEMTPIKNVASITCPSATQLIIKPFDPTCVKLILGAIGDSELGINPIVDGIQIRLNFPQLTGERRKEFVKQAKEYCDEGKIAIRNIRRDIIDLIKKDKEMSKDLSQTLQADVQKETDKYNKLVDTIFATKEKELLTL